MGFKYESLLSQIFIYQIRKVPRSKSQLGQFYKIIYFIGDIVSKNNVALYIQKQRIKSLLFSEIVLGWYLWPIETYEHYT